MNSPGDKSPDEDGNSSKFSDIDHSLLRNLVLDPGMEHYDDSADEDDMCGSPSGAKKAEKAKWSTDEVRH